MEQDNFYTLPEGPLDLSTPIARLQYVIGQLSTTYGLKKTAIAAALKRQDVFIWRVQKGLSVNPLATDIANGLESLGVNMDWYMNGGPANVAFIKPPSSGGQAKPALHPSIRHVPDVQTVMLPFVSVAARAGFAQTFAHQTETSYELRPYINYTSQDLSDCYLVEVDGDSMEPTFSRGSVLLVRPLLGDKRLLLPGIYVVTFEDYLVVKRIKENRITTAGTLELYSDNPLSGPITLQAEMLDDAKFFKVIEARVTY